MKIQLNTDVNIEATEALAAQVSATVEQALARFREHITRVTTVRLKVEQIQLVSDVGQVDLWCIGLQGA